LEHLLHPRGVSKDRTFLTQRWSRVAEVAQTVLLDLEQVCLVRGAQVRRAGRDTLPVKGLRLSLLSKKARQIAQPAGAICEIAWPNCRHSLQRL